MSYDVYDVSRVLDIDETCNNTKNLQDEINHYKNLIRDEQKNILKSEYEKHLTYLLELQKKNKGKHILSTDMHENYIEHPAYYIKIGNTNYCFNARDMYKMGLNNSNLFHGTDKKFSNPPHHDFQNLEDRLRDAVMRNHSIDVELLIKMGADVNAIISSFLDTLLHHAAFRGHEEVVDILIRAGAKVDEKDAYGKTPLHWSAEGGHEKVVENLIRAGANVNEKDRNGYSPMFLAQLNNHTNAKNVLSKNGAIDDDGFDILPQEDSNDDNIPPDFFVRIYE
jgi:ankyrin repeat protein